MQYLLKQTRISYTQVDTMYHIIIFQNVNLETGIENLHYWRNHHETGIGSLHLGRRSETLHLDPYLEKIYKYIISTIKSISI